MSFVSVAILFLSSVSMAQTPNVKSVLLVTGMANELKVATQYGSDGGRGIVATCGAIDAKLLRARLRQFDVSKVRAVISFGVTGGLDPKLQHGDLVIASQVISDHGKFKPSAQISALLKSRLQTAGIRVSEKVLYSHDVLTNETAAEIYTRTGADVVDNETKIVAEFAKANGLPFAALRAVSDSPDMIIPPAAFIPFKADCSPDTQAVLASVMKEPWQTPHLISLAISTNSALNTLKRARWFLTADDFAGKK